MPVLPPNKSITPAANTPQTESNHAADKPTAPQSEPNPISTNAADPAKSVGRGSLNSIATKRVLPHYPPFGRKMGMAGMVRVYVILDEKGRVVEVPKTDGPSLLRSAAESAARQWLFAPSLSDGRPIRVSGYIDFTSHSEPTCSAVPQRICNKAKHLPIVDLKVRIS
ncbi:MAG: energy transducer TonB [bacterium]